MARRRIAAIPRSRGQGHISGIDPVVLGMGPGAARRNDLIAETLCDPEPTSGALRHLLPSGEGFTRQPKLRVNQFIQRPERSLWVGVPPDKQPEAVEKVITQAELLADHWAHERD